MKLKIVQLVIIFSSIMVFCQPQNESIYVASWNLENLFDNIDDPEKRDEEWLLEGYKEWSKERIDQKIKNLSKVIRYMNEMEGPDLLGVQEVEHQHLLDSILIKYFSDRNYKVSYTETLDNRGIDNGLIYDADKFELVETIPHEIKLDDGYPTRYVFQTTLKHIKNELLIYTFVNHWPSRRGGEEKSRPNRIRAAETLNKALENIYANEENPNIIIMGDFNDEPDNISIVETLGAAKYICDSTKISETYKLYNLAFDEFSRGWGTYMYKGDWNMLDQIIVSKNLIKDSNFNYVCNSFEIIKPEILVTSTGPFKGASRPTFGGRTYLGGYSDHFPVGAKFIIN